MNTGIIFAYDMFCVIQFTCISNSMLVPCVRHTFLPFPIFLLTFHQNNNLQYKKTIKWKLRTKFLKVFNTQKAVEYMYNPAYYSCYELDKLDFLMGSCESFINMVSKAWNMCKIFSLVPSKKLLNRENWPKHQFCQIVKCQMVFFGITVNSITQKLKS